MLAQSNKFYLLVILHGGDLRESPSTELTTVRLLSCVTPHMALQTRGLEEPFSTLVAEMGALIVVLFPVKNCGVPVCEFSPTVFTLMDLSHPMTLNLLLALYI